MTAEEDTIPAIIPATKYQEYGLVSDPTVKQRPPTSLRLPAKPPHTVLAKDESLVSASSKILVDLWGAFYIQPHVKAMDPIFSGKLLREEANPDYLARAICRGALLNCIVDACDSTSILYSTAIDAILTMPWLRFGPSGDNGKASRFSGQCVDSAHETLTPIFNILNNELARMPASIAIAEEISLIIHHHVVSISAGVPVAFSDAQSIDALTPSGQDSVAYHPCKPLSWGDISYETLISDKGTCHMFKPVALILREASNERHQRTAGDEMLHRVLIGHDATNKRPPTSMHDRDLTDPVRRYSVSAQFCIKHLPPALLSGRHGLSNLLAWFGTGQGNMTQEFLSTVSMFFSTSAEDLVAKFEPSLTHNATVRARHGYKIGKKAARLPDLIVVHNSRIWGQPSNQLSLLSHKTDSLTDAAAVHKKFAEIFAHSLQEDWEIFLGPVYGCENPLEFTGNRPSWYDTVKFIAGLRIPGFKNGLTTIQCANCLAFAHIVDPPDSLSMASWIFSHHDLGAFRGLTKLGFTIEGITSVAAAFDIVHDHLVRHLCESDLDCLGFSGGFSVIAVEHILCKVSRWEKRLDSSDLSWNDFRCPDSKRDSTDPERSPIPLTPTPELIAEIISRAKVWPSLS